VPTVDRGGSRIFFEEQGTGPCIVFGHSFLCSGAMWAAQVRGLADRARAVNVDLRGHGRSSPSSGTFGLDDMVDDVLAVLDAVHADRAVWAGLSIGGMVALRAALRAPERVSGLVLADTTARAETARKRIEYGALALVVRLAGLRPVLPVVMRLMFGATTRRRRPDLVAEWRERFASAHVGSMLATLRALLDRESVGPLLGGIRAPCLVIVGEEDASLPPSHSREIASGIPGSRLVVVPGAGHLSALEQPEVVTSAMREFLGALPTW